MSEDTRGDYQDQWDHVDPLYLIRQTKGFIVFLDKEGDLDWETTKEYDSEGHKDFDAHNSIMNDAALLEETPSEGLQAKQIRQFKRLIGEAMVCSFEHDYGNARKMLVAAAKYMRDRSEETSRMWYLCASCVMTIPFGLLGSIVWLYRANAGILLGYQGMWLVLSCSAGALGALFSVIQRSGKLKLDCAAGRWLHYLEGSSRICAGVLAGFLVSLAVKYEIILGPLARGDKMPGIMLIAALVAGFSEQLASSIISKFGSTQEDISSGKGESGQTGQESPSGA
jgi:hypothetical protein